MLQQNSNRHECIELWAVVGQKYQTLRGLRTSFPPRDIRKKPRSMCARVPQAMAQFVLKIEKWSQIMGTAPIVELARAYGLHYRLWLLKEAKYPHSTREKCIQKSKSPHFPHHKGGNFVAKSPLSPRIPPHQPRVPTPLGEADDKCSSEVVLLPCPTKLQFSTTWPEIPVMATAHARDFLAIWPPNTQRKCMAEIKQNKMEQVLAYREQVPRSGRVLESFLGYSD